ncbi:MAG: hypothetical protein WCA81_17165 [Rhizomicrobium sp.]
MHHVTRLITAVAFVLSATNDANAADTTQATGQALALSLFQQVARCWSPPRPQSGSQSIVIRLQVDLNTDGQIIGTPTLVDKPDVSIPGVSEAINAATRAVYTCAPYKLPAAQYSMWKKVVFTFDRERFAGTL